MVDCPACGTPLIHGGDHDIEDEDGAGIVSNFSCPECPTYAVFYFYEEEY